MNTSDPPKIVIVCGPTGVGKTAFAIELAKRFGGEIVGADSMQIYRRMDIGTAKPTAEEKAVVPHHMVDIIAPDEPFDAAAYGRRADAIVTQLLADNKIAFVVGGTGLYIKALIYGLFKGRTVDDRVRQTLQARLADEGAPALYDALKDRDPSAAARIHPNDTYRILRALEVVETTGRAISEFHEAHHFGKARYRGSYIGLTLPREQLYARIDGRVDAMIAAGLLEEVRGLLASGYGPELKSMQSLGYRHMIAYIQGELTWDEALRTLKRDHRRYAKRQLTWFKAVDGMHWLAPDEIDTAAEQIDRFFAAA
ncbi:tRNA (adenosine(37)-N6)-dimethylallyltransferase MiaA [Desulfatitalea tepidiphila]|uniref:tRNA (adenosine(37)-N6)-dimethylallyltransferase MiaA n=1 Tax=Desulfatitalea tepidiphila TaxID=1185843 RepID=UPI0006B54E12|nr:tRNA (adenosine(37)-N6)-dimethylallyltransferase MiaA [Desulfatitalea tepidiphila]